METLSLFVLIGTLFLQCSHVNSEGSIGCLFSREVCDQREWCFDDNVFGRCLSAYEPVDDTNFYRYDLEKNLLSRLEHEMRRLFRAGYQWGHTYTQCILQNLLYSHRYNLNYNPSLCKDEVNLDPTVDLIKTNAKDLATIYFTPSELDKHSEFADELYIPPLNPEKHHRPELFGSGKKFSQDEKPSSNGVNQRVFKRVYPGDETADMTREQVLELLKSMALRQKEEEQLMEFSKQIDNDDRDWKDGEQDGPYYDQFGPVPPEDLQQLEERDEEVAQENSVNDFFDSPPINEDVFGQGLSDDGVFDDEVYDRTNDVGNRYWDSGFKRLHRYDVKKPGPNFMNNLEDLDSTEAVVNEQLQQAELFKLLDQVVNQKQLEQQQQLQQQQLNQQQAQSQQNNDTVLDQNLTADGMMNSVRGEAERIEDAAELKSEGTNSQVAEVQATADDLVDASKRKQDGLSKGTLISASLYGAQPKMLPKTKDGYDVIDTSYAYVIVDSKFASEDEGKEFVATLQHLLELPQGAFSDIRVDRDQVIFKVNSNSAGINASEVATKAESLKAELKEATGKLVTSSGIGNQVKISVLNLDNDKKLFIITFVVCGCLAGILIAAAVIAVVRRHARSREKLQALGRPDTEPSHDYQDLCRQRMANKSNEKPEPIHVGQRVSSLSKESETSARSPSSRSSTSSWSEEPVTSNMDISTGHMVLSYMEDHLKNKDRLEQEWVALCAYEAEPCGTLVATQPENMKKNRYPDVLPYDHSRVVLNDLTNLEESDYINASTITDHDPRNPAYIATQGPLPHTAADYWQMVWEQGSVVIVTLTRLVENGVAMCHRYWPEEGSERYHIYEVHLVSEHIWCDDYLVRSFYLKNLKTGETRTVTQFHFLSWPDNGVPVSVKALLDFRRKVNKSYRGRSCPIVVQCSDGSGRTGTYFLIDMVLNRMAKGAKEIDIAATLEHIRDQRLLMVKTKAQFEFALMAVAEEVHAILKALPQ